MIRAVSRALLLLLVPFFAAVSPAPVTAGHPAETPTLQRQIDTMKGAVWVFTQRAITVRDPKNIYRVRTFSYDPKLLPKMQKRHYKQGDKVKVKYLRGTDIAVSVK